MRFVLTLFIVGGLFLSVLGGQAQPPKRPDGGPKEKKDRKGKGGPGETARTGNPDLVTYLLSFDRNKDGKLTRQELTDTRLHRLFDRADHDKAGFVTREALELVQARLMADHDAGPAGPPGR